MLYNYVRINYADSIIVILGHVAGVNHWFLRMRYVSKADDQWIGLNRSQTMKTWVTIWLLNIAMENHHFQ